MPAKTLKCFVSYCKEDKKMFNKFISHFSSLQHLIDAEAWHRGEIVLGQKITDEIKKNLEESDVIFLLISPNYIASKWCSKEEMKVALQKHKKKKCLVIPVIIQRIMDGDFPFKDIQIVPASGKAISDFKSHNDGFVDAFNSIRTLLNDFLDSTYNKKANKNYNKENQTAKPLQYAIISNGKISKRKLSQSTFDSMISYNEQEVKFMFDMYQLTQRCCTAFQKNINANKAKRDSKFEWQHACLKDFAFQMAGYIQKCFIGVHDTCVHLRVRDGDYYKEVLEIGYSEFGLQTSDIIAKNGMIEASKNCGMPAIKSNNIPLHSKSHPNEIINRDYITCYFPFLRETYGVSLALCISCVIKNKNKTTQIKNKLIAMSLRRIDLLIEGYLNQYFSFCRGLDKEYDVNKILNR